MDPDAVWGGEWGRARYGCIRFWSWSSKGKGQFGVNTMQKLGIDRLSTRVWKVDNISLYADYIVEFSVEFPFLRCSQVQDRIGGWREIQVQKRNKTDATWRYARAVNSYSRQTCCCSTAYTPAYGCIRRVPSSAESHSARLVLNGDNMLGLCDPNNLLLVLSAEERRILLKSLWGGLVHLYSPN